MRVIGISSATSVISIGLIDDDVVLVDRTVADIRAEKVIYYVKKSGIKPEQIDGVAAAMGPGSYSGLRGGLAAAKSLAQTLEVPLVGVSTLEAIAYNLINIEGKIGVVLDAKLDDYNFALFESNGKQLKRLMEDQVLKLPAIKKLKGKITFAEGENSHPYGVNVARLGLQKIRAGKTIDPLKLAPRYSHQPNVRAF